jgi:hypothetical protein
MHYLNILGVQSYQCGPEIPELAFEEYVDRQFTIGLVPPGLSTLEISHLVLREHQPTVIVEADNIVILVLYYAHVFQITLPDQAQEREFVPQGVKNFVHLISINTVKYVLCKQSQGIY